MCSHVSGGVRFGEVKVSPTTIRRIYLKHKIRFKNIKRGKREINFSDPHYSSLFHALAAAPSKGIKH